MDYVNILTDIILEKLGRLNIGLNKEKLRLALEKSFAGVDLKKIEVQLKSKGITIEKFLDILSENIVKIASKVKEKAEKLKQKGKEVDIKDITIELEKGLKLFGNLKGEAGKFLSRVFKNIAESIKEGIDEATKDIQKIEVKRGRKKKEKIDIEKGLEEEVKDTKDTGEKFKKYVDKKKKLLEKERELLEKYEKDVIEAEKKNILKRKKKEEILGKAEQEAIEEEKELFEKAEREKKKASELKKRIKQKIEGEKTIEELTEEKELEEYNKLKREVSKRKAKAKTFKEQPELLKELEKVKKEEQERVKEAKEAIEKEKSIIEKLQEARKKIADKVEKEYLKQLAELEKIIGDPEVIKGILEAKERIRREKEKIKKTAKKEIKEEEPKEKVKDILPEVKEKEEKKELVEKAKAVLRKKEITDFLANFLNVFNVISQDLSKGIIGLISKGKVSLTKILKGDVGEATSELEKLKQKLIENKKTNFDFYLDNLIKKFKEAGKNTEEFKNVQTDLGNAVKNTQKFVNNIIKNFEEFKNLDKYIFNIDIFSFKIFGLSAGLKELGFRLTEFGNRLLMVVTDIVHSTEDLFLIERKLGAFSKSIVQVGRDFSYLTERSIKTVFTIQEFSEAMVQFYAIGLRNKEILDLVADTATAFGTQMTTIADDIARALEGDAIAFRNLRHSIGLTNNNILKFGGVLDSAGRLVLKNTDALNKNRQAVINYLRQYEGLSEKVLGTPPQIIKNFNDMLLVVKKTIAEGFTPLLEILNKISLKLLDLTKEETFKNFLRTIGYIIPVIAILAKGLGGLITLFTTLITPILTLITLIPTALYSITLLFTNFNKFSKVLPFLGTALSFLKGTLEKLFLAIQKFASIFSKILPLLSLRFLIPASLVLTAIATALILVISKLNEKTQKLKVQETILNEISKLYKEIANEQVFIFSYSDRIAKKYENLLDLIENINRAESRRKRDKELEKQDLEDIRKKIIELSEEATFEIDTEEIIMNYKRLLTDMSELTRLNFKKLGKDIDNFVVEFQKKMENLTLFPIEIRTGKEIVDFYQSINDYIEEYFKKLMQLTEKLTNATEKERMYNEVLKQKQIIMDLLNKEQEKAIENFIKNLEDKNKELINVYNVVLEREGQLKIKEITEKQLGELYKSIKPLKIKLDFDVSTKTLTSFIEYYQKEKLRLQKDIIALEKERLERIKAVKIENEKHQEYIRNIEKEIKALEERRRVLEENYKILQKELPDFAPSLRQYKEEIEKINTLIKINQERLEELKKEPVKIVDTKDIDTKIERIKQQIEAVNDIIEHSNEQLSKYYSNLADNAEIVLDNYRETIQALINIGLSFEEAKNKAMEFYDKVLKNNKQLQEQLGTTLEQAIKYIDIDFVIKEIEKIAGIIEQIGTIPVELNNKVIEYVKILKDMGIDVEQVLTRLGLKLEGMRISRLVNPEDLERIKLLIEYAENYNEIVFKTIDNITDRFEITKLALDKVLEIFEGKSFVLVEDLTEDFIEAQKKIIQLTRDFPNLYDIYILKLKQALKLKKEELDYEKQIKEEVKERLRELAKQGIVVTKLALEVDGTKFLRELERIRDIERRREDSLRVVDRLEEIIDIIRTKAEEGIEEFKQLAEKIGIKLKENVGVKLDRMIGLLVDVNKARQATKEEQRTQKLQKEVEERGRPFTLSSSFQVKPIEEIKDEAQKSISYIQRLIEDLRNYQDKARETGDSRLMYIINNAIRDLINIQERIPSMVPALTSFSPNFEMVIQQAQRIFNQALDSISRELEQSLNQATQGMLDYVNQFGIHTQTFGNAVERFNTAISRLPTNTSPVNTRIIPDITGNRE